MIKNTLNSKNSILINDALEYQLYVEKEGFLLKYTLEDYQKNPHFALGLKMSLYYDNSCPVALALYDSNQYYTVQVFTKNEFRNKGIAKILIADVFTQIDEKEKRKIRAGIGEDESCHLWLSLVRDNIMKEKQFDEFDVIEQIAETRKVKLFIENFRKAS